MMHGLPESPKWADALLSDAESVAFAIFRDPQQVVALMRALQHSVNNVDRMPPEYPSHDEWSHIALIVQLLVCSADVDDGCEESPVRRLGAFLEENDDLLAIPVEAVAPHSRSLAWKMSTLASW